MSESYEDLDRSYQAHLQRVRTFLAGTRTRSSLIECERLLGEAKDCAITMQGVAEQQLHDPIRAREAQRRMQQDLAPLSKEVQRALEEWMGREELFQSTTSESSAFSNSNSDLESLIQSSESLLRESNALCAESEHLGDATILQLGRQREQLEVAATHLEATRNVAIQASFVLRSMSRKAFKSKLFLCFLIAVLLGANLWVIVWLFNKK